MLVHVRKSFGAVHSLNHDLKSVSDVDALPGGLGVELAAVYGVPVAVYILNGDSSVVNGEDAGGDS